MLIKRRLNRALGYIFECMRAVAYARALRKTTWSKSQSLEKKADIHRYLNELIPELTKAAIEEGKKAKKT